MATKPTLKPEPLKIILQEAAYHRNGTAGVGFWAVRFRYAPPDTKKEENFVATIFDDFGGCAVLSLDRMASHGIAFGRGNSWHGDVFGDRLREEIESIGNVMEVPGP